jgi:hypothetical protein
LAAVLATALISLQFTAPDERAGALPIPDKPSLGAFGERLNANTIAVVSGNPNATYLSIAYDPSDVLDDGDNFRILPVVPGWTRLPEAADWLERNREKQSAIMTDAGSALQPSPATERPHNVGGPPQDPAAHDQLFQEFVNWQARRQ